MKFLSITYFVFILASVVQSALLGIDYGGDFLKSTLIAPGIPFEIVLTLETKRKEPLSIAMKLIADSKNEFERFYGYASTPICSRFPETCVTALKSLLGQPYSNQTLIEHYSSMHPGVQMLENEKRGTVDFQFDDGSVYQIEEINAMVLSHIKDRAQKFLKQETGSSYLSDVVLTVPSYFTSSQRLALINSANIAGFVNVRLIDDGVAVAVNYASNNIKFNEKKKQYHLIYDMGSTSTKATLLSFEKDEKSSDSSIEVLGYAVDQSLGGEHFTKTIFDLLKTKFLEKHPSVDAKAFTSNKKAMNKLWQSAEKTKLILSANNEASSSVESLYNDVDFRAIISRQEFEAANAASIGRIIQPVLESLASDLSSSGKKFDIKQLDSILLFGGSTRVPMVQKELANLVGKDSISKNVNSDEAAVQGGTLRGVVLSKMFRAKEIGVTEHSLYDYDMDYSVDGKSSKKISVFQKGSNLGNVVKIELGNLKNIDNKEFEINLYENDELVETDKFKNAKSEIKKAVDKLSKEYDLEKCKKDSGLTYDAYFTLDYSRLFELKNVTASCSSESNGSKGFLQGILLNKDEEEIDEDANDTNSTEPAKSKSIKPKKLNTIVSHSKEYPAIKPLTAMQRDSSERKLRDLSYKDQIRVQKTELMNSLEGELYSLRSTVDDIIDEIEEGTSKKFTNKEMKYVKAFKQLINDYLEWLEDQSYGKGLKDLKTSFINKKIEKLNIIDSYLNNPIGAKHFTVLANQGTKVYEEFSALSKTFSDEFEALSQTYLDNDLTIQNFEKDSQKISKSAVLKIEELNLEKESLNFVETLEKIDEVINELESTGERNGDDDDISTEDAEQILKSFRLYTTTSSKIVDLQKMIAKIEKEQSRRVKQLKKMMDSRLKKRKEKLEKTDDDSTLVESSEQDKPTEDLNAHDEL